MLFADEPTGNLDPKASKNIMEILKQNFGLALCYNAVAIPLAVMGFATPLVASIAMSSSSVLVTLNALRLRIDKKPRTVEPEIVPQTKVMPAE